VTTPYEDPTLSLDVPAPTRQHWGWAYALIWVVVAALIAWGGTQSDGYLEHVRNIPPPHPYPGRLVFVLAIVLAVQLGIFALVLHLGARGPTVWREWVAAAVAFGFVGLAVSGSMHANPAYIDWMICTILAFGAMTTRAVVRTAFAALAALRRGRAGTAG